MIGVLKWDVKTAFKGSLRELILCYDAHLIDSWDRTATISALLHNLGVIVSKAVSKTSTAKPKSLLDFHPFRESKPPRKVTTKNFGVLRELGRAIARK